MSTRMFILKMAILAQKKSNGKRLLSLDSHCKTEFLKSSTKSGKPPLNVTRLVTPYLALLFLSLPHKQFFDSWDKPMFFGFPLKNPIQRWIVREIGAFLPRQGQGKRHFSTQILVEIRGQFRIGFGLVLSCRIVHSANGIAEINCAEAGARVAGTHAECIAFKNFLNPGRTKV